MRVVTHLGFGRAVSGFDPMHVLLDQPFLGKREQTMNRREVFPSTQKAVIRVLNISGVGIVSNLRFIEDTPEHYRPPFGTPPDETHFVFDLKTGQAEASQALGFMTEPYLLMRPFADRWAPERSSMFEREDEAIAAFDAELERLAGSMGIGTMALFSTHEGRLLRFNIIIMTPQGVIYDWIPVVPLPPNQQRLLDV